MDFGFGSLVDKFDERVGKKVTSALLWLASVAAFTVCIRTIVTEGVVPLVELVRGVSSESAQSVIGGFLIGLAIAVVSGAVFVATIRWLVQRKVVPLVLKAEAHVQEADRLTIQAKAYTAEMEERIERLTEVVEEKARKLSQDESRR